MKQKLANVRLLRRTALIVCEGYAEEALIRHCKTIWLERDAGLVVTIKNARGKGAEHVVDYALRQAANAQFDRLFAVFDTDTDWTERVQARVEEAQLQVIAAEPCLEAVLLTVHGQAVTGKTAAALKKQFEKRFGAPAHEPRVYEQHFGAVWLNQVCARHAFLQSIQAVFTA
jgi:3-methyladenine DNA glycosylase/8-oxoguanine DNA glycosylase